MRRLLFFVSIVALAGLWASGCSNQDGPISPQANGGPRIDVFAAFPDGGIPCGDPLTVTLWAGQNIDVGTVTVTVVDEVLCVDIQTTGNWVMTETHLAIASSLDSIPQTGSDNPQVGKFLFSTEHDPPVTSFSYCTDPTLFIYEPGDVYIAVHASVELLDDAGSPVQEETAWADGPGFPGRNWATYLTYNVQSCDEGPDCELTVTFPNDGDTLCIDSDTMLTWTSLGGACGEDVSIELLLDGVPCMPIVPLDEESPPAPNSGMYPWFIQACGTVEYGYTIRITDLDTGLVDESDAPFYILLCDGPE